MNSQRLAIFLIFALAMSWCVTATAHRYFTEPLSPIVANGIEYRVTQNVHRRETVQAFDRKLGQKLWESQVYNVWINPSVEADVQWILINSIQLKAEKLVVTNELGNIFTLDPATGKVDTGIVNYLGPIVLVSVPIVFLLFINISFTFVRKLLLARATKHYSSSQKENKIYVIFGKTGGLLAGLSALFSIFNALIVLLKSVFNADGTLFSGITIIPELNHYLLQYLSLTLFIVLAFSIGVYLFSLLGELTILIKRKTESA